MTKVIQLPNPAAGAQAAYQITGFKRYRILGVTAIMDNTVVATAAAQLLQINLYGMLLWTSKPIDVLANGSMTSCWAIGTQFQQGGGVSPNRSQAALPDWYFDDDEEVFVIVGRDGGSALTLITTVSIIIDYRTAPRPRIGKVLTGE